MITKFNRVTGLKFLYENFPFLFNKERIQLFFVNDKNELNNLKIKNQNFDTYVLKRSGNEQNAFLSDIKCKDNRFFDTLEQLKMGASEFEDIFIYCVECHKFKKGESYYSDKLAIAQFTTDFYCDDHDKVSFIPSVKPGVSTRDNEPYLIIDYPFDSENIFHTKKLNNLPIDEYGFGDYEISLLAKNIEHIISILREFLMEQQIYDTFQLILRVDSYLNLLPIDFRTTNAWVNLKK